MEVVDVEDAFDRGHGFADFCEFERAGGAFEEDMEGFADDADRRPEDHGGDDEGEGGVDPREVGEEDGGAAEDDGCGGQGIAEHVEEDGADVDVAGEAPEKGGDGAVHQHTGGGDEHHEARLDGDGRGEAVEGGDGDPEGEHDQGEGVDKGGEDAGALVAEGFLVGGGAGLEVDGDEGEDDGEEVGEVVAGLGDEGERVGAEAEDKGGDDVEGGRGHGDFEDALHAAVWTGNHVHGLSLCPSGMGVQYGWAEWRRGYLGAVKQGFTGVDGFRSEID